MGLKALVAWVLRKNIFIVASLMKIKVKKILKKMKLSTGQTEEEETEFLIEEQETEVHLFVYLIKKT